MVQNADVDSAVSTQDSAPRPKAKIANSVFTNLFRIPKYSLQLYESLHPEAKTVTQNQIRIVTLENILLNQSYNDFGMIVRGVANEDDVPGDSAELIRTSEATDIPEPENLPQLEDRFLILCEAQSTWSLNILVRMLIYWAQTLQEYIVETKQNLYGSKKVKFPVPEFYIVYTGDRKTRPEMISLSKEFKVASADLKIKMIYDGEKGDIINQYVAFVQVYREQYKLYGRTQKTILETIRICEDRNILKEYLESRKKEVVDIMMTLFNNEAIMDAYTEEIREEGELKAKRETAFELSAMGLSVEKIARAVKVSVSTVKQWLDAGMAVAR